MKYKILLATILVSFCNNTVLLATPSFPHSPKPKPNNTLSKNAVQTGPQFSPAKLIAVLQSPVSTSDELIVALQQCQQHKLVSKEAYSAYISILFRKKINSSPATADATIADPTTSNSTNTYAAASELAAKLVAKFASYNRFQFDQLMQTNLIDWARPQDKLTAILENIDQSDIEKIRLLAEFIRQTKDLNQSILSEQRLLEKALQSLSRLDLPSLRPSELTSLLLSIDIYQCSSNCASDDINRINERFGYHNIAEINPVLVKWYESISNQRLLFRSQLEDVGRMFQIYKSEQKHEYLPAIKWLAKKIIANKKELSLTDQLYLRQILAPDELVAAFSLRTQYVCSRVY